MIVISKTKFGAKSRNIAFSASSGPKDIGLCDANHNIGIEELINADLMVQ